MWFSVIVIPVDGMKSISRFLFACIEHTVDYCVQEQPMLQDRQAI